MILSVGYLHQRLFVVTMQGNKTEAIKLLKQPNRSSLNEVNNGVLFCTPIRLNVNMKKLFITLVLGVSVMACSKNKTHDIESDQNSTIAYTADDATTIINPERGWYFSFTPPCCDVPPNDINPPHPPLNVQQLQEMRNWEEKVTLYRDIIKIEQYAGDIPQARLDEIQADLDAARAAGVKSIFRIIYNYGMKIGEASPNVISRHLDQIKPIIQKNADVIYVVQAGLFGGSGEACCDSWLIDEDNNNGWPALSSEAIVLYKKLLAIVPPDRFVNLRYPRYKYQMVGWSNSDRMRVVDFPSDARAITAEKAFDGSDQARLGYHNENFAGDIDHWGMFNAWEEKDRNFTEADSRYTLMEGELSWTSEFNNANGASEMKKYHYSAFHCCGNNVKGEEYEGWFGPDVAWKNSGQMDIMSRSLGYRFRLVSASVPQNLSPDASFKMNVVMANDGWAGIMNPRKVEIVFRNKVTGAKFILDIDGDGRGNRRWLPGPGETKTLTISQSLPDNIENGTYDLFLHLADPYPSIHDRPEYSIRLANKNLWQADTGYNSLMASVSISDNF